MVGMQQFSGEVFSQTLSEEAYKEKTISDDILNLELAKASDDPALMAHINDIRSAEEKYRLQTESYWNEAAATLAAMGDCQNIQQSKCDIQLAVKSRLLRESHVADAEMFTKFKALRNYLKDNGKDTWIAMALEQNFEMTKRCVLLHEIAN